MQLVFWLDTIFEIIVFLIIIIVIIVIANNFKDIFLKSLGVISLFSLAFKGCNPSSIISGSN